MESRIPADQFVRPYETVISRVGQHLIVCMPFAWRGPHEFAELGTDGQHYQIDNDGTRHPNGGCAQWGGGCPAKEAREAVRRGRTESGSQ